MKALPNILTSLRLLLGLVMFLCLAGAAGGIPYASDMLTGEQQFQLEKIAFVAFVVAGTTDFLDGWLARKLNAVSVWGAILDPIGDKILICGTILGIAAPGPVPGHGPALGPDPVPGIRRQRPARGRGRARPAPAGDHPGQVEDHPAADRLRGRAAGGLLARLGPAQRPGHLRRRLHHRPRPVVDRGLRHRGDRLPILERRPACSCGRRKPVIPESREADSSGTQQLYPDRAARQGLCCWVPGSRKRAPRNDDRFWSAYPSAVIPESREADSSGTQQLHPDRAARQGLRCWVPGSRKSAPRNDDRFWSAYPSAVIPESREADSSGTQQRKPQRAAR